MTLRLLIKNGKSRLKVTSKPGRKKEEGLPSPPQLDNDVGVVKVTTMWMNYPLFG